MSTNSTATAAGATPPMDPVMFGAIMAQFFICSTGLLMNGFLVNVILRNRWANSYKNMYKIFKNKNIILIKIQ
jgi:hypothetical protein